MPLKQMAIFYGDNIILRSCSTSLAGSVNLLIRALGSALKTKLSLIDARLQQLTIWHTSHGETSEQTIERLLENLIGEFEDGRIPSESQMNWMPMESVNYTPHNLQYRKQMNGYVYFLDGEDAIDDGPIETLTVESVTVRRLASRNKTLPRGNNYRIVAILKVVAKGESDAKTEANNSSLESG